MKKRSFPLLSSLVPAGFPSVAEDHIDRALDLNELLIEHPAATFFVRASGDSMIKAGIFPNDILIVDRAVTPRHGKIVIARVGGELTVKRLHKKGSSIMLVPENDGYESLVITAAMDFEVWGVVTCVLHAV